MSLTQEENKRIKDHLDTCKKPLFLFDDDADGMSAFLLFYRYIKEGKGVIIKSKPEIDEKFLAKVTEYDPDKIFVLDIAIMKQEFADAAKKPIVWIDHHGPNDINGVDYFNPRKHEAHIVYPTANLCYDVVKEDLWIAMTGCVGDWMLPHFKDEFCAQYPDLLDSSITSPPQALFDSPLGKLVRIFNFNLKGSSGDAMKSVKVLTRIKTPYEILNQETSQGKYIYGKYERVNGAYEDLYKDAASHASDDRFLIYHYNDDKMSFTSDLSNELLYRHPEKIIIIARKKSGEMRMSLRSTDVILPPILDKVLVGLEGYGGGHEHACGCCVREDQFEEFVSRLRKEIS